MKEVTPAPSTTWIFLSTIQFASLTMLTMDGFRLLDGSYLPTVKNSTLLFKYLIFLFIDFSILFTQIAMQCPKLQKLHLGDGGTSSDAFLLQVGNCVAKIPDLRDLRFEMIKKEEA